MRSAVRSSTTLSQHVVIAFVLEEHTCEGNLTQIADASNRTITTEAVAEQQRQPTQQLRGARLLAELELAELVEDLDRLRDDLRRGIREMCIDDHLHLLRVRERDVDEGAAAQECGGQLLLVVARDHDDRAVFRGHRPTQLGHLHFHPVELVQEIVREFEVRLVDLVDEDHGSLIAIERLPEDARDDEVAHVVEPGEQCGDFVGSGKLPHLRLFEKSHSSDVIDFVAERLRLGCATNGSVEQRYAELRRDHLGEHGLAGAGFTLQQQRHLQQHRRLNRLLKGGGNDVPAHSSERVNLAIRSHRCRAFRWYCECGITSRSVRTSPFKSK